MAPKEKKTKAQIAAAAASGGRAKKKKWSKGKQQDKLNNSVVFDKATYSKLMAEIPKTRLITPSFISERFRVTVSLARAAIKDLEAKELIQRVGTKHHAQSIYTRCSAAQE